jgi:hypothetical protein
LVAQGVLPATWPSNSNASLSLATVEMYLWNLADAIPVLKVPETLMWTPALTLTSTLGGAFVLAFKIVVILPFAQLLGAMLARTFGLPQAQSGSQAEAGVEANAPNSPTPGERD